METFIKKTKDTIISGIILSLPIFILIAIYQKLYGFLYGFGHKITAALGLHEVEGVDIAPILTSLLLIVALYVFGLLGRVSKIVNGKDWIENNVLTYIPTYSKYKATMMKKLQPGEDLRQPVFVEMAEGWKPGLLVHAEKQKATVFLPSTPDTDLGEVWVVDEAKVRQVNMTAKEFKTAVLLSGKGLKVEA
ncbi:DUF502 domain-containing protein [Sediminicola luteus]|uniref:DUF502 domain-containing protein n=1 Tax=Sediminicola luteus TaxID=319238 RepID=A0A2A4GE06_9FLAO|nr:hypothetical protein [Sediminicola luteus]PCE66224.1 hypothetical protein B7P33_02690 [Sediminicola luteus]